MHTKYQMFSFAGETKLSAAMLCLGTLYIFLMIGKINTQDWGYEKGNGPATWPDPLCQSGQRQSPINLSHKATLVDGWSPFVLQDYEQKPVNMFVANDGHTVKIKMEFGDKAPRISQGNLPGIYELADVHFHWGWFDSKGSEHEIDGVS